MRGAKPFVCAALNIICGFASDFLEGLAPIVIFIRVFGDISPKTLRGKPILSPHPALRATLSVLGEGQPYHSTYLLLMPLD